MIDRFRSLRFRLRGSLSGKVLIGVLIGSIVLMIPLAVLSNPAHILAPTGPLTVWGYVYDFDGQPIVGANVVVTDQRTSVTSSGTTNAIGLYQALPEFASSDYDIDDIMEVVSTYNTNPQSNTTKVTQDMIDSGLAQVDVHYTYEIPEFGSMLGYAIASILIGMVAVVALGTRKARKGR